MIKTGNVSVEGGNSKHWTTGNTAVVLVTSTIFAAGSTQRRDQALLNRRCSHATWSLVEFEPLSSGCSQ